MHKIYSEINNEITQKTDAVLPDSLSRIVEEARDFIAIDARDCISHAWLNRCLCVREVTAYLRKNGWSQDGIFAKGIAIAAARSYEGLGTNKVLYPTAKEIKSVKGKALRLSKEISGKTWLPSHARTHEFRRGLAALGSVYPCTRKAGENNKGNPDRRHFIAKLSSCLFTMVNEIPINVVVGLTGILWDTIDERTVRSFLTNDKKSEIIEKAKKVIKDSEVSATQTVMAMNRLSVPVGLAHESKKHVQDDQGAVLSAIESIKTVSSPALKRDMLDQIRIICEEHNFPLDNTIFI